jgi:hypothetical protein
MAPTPTTTNSGNKIAEARFHRAVDMVQSFPKSGPVNTTYEEKLMLYSLYKQGESGFVIPFFPPPQIPLDSRVAECFAHCSHRRPSDDDPPEAPRFPRPRKMGCLESAPRLDEAASSGELCRYIDEYIEELQ